MPHRANATSFKPGQSGNPLGKRPGTKSATAVIAQALAHCPEAIETLVQSLSDPRHKVAAAVALLDRGLGKPAQQIIGNSDQPIAFEIVWGPAREPQTPVIEANAEETTEIAEAEVVWGSANDAPSD